jgi:glycosyltransferase involved in cell wall biosynthesis
LIKTLLLTNTIAPYRIPVLNKINEEKDIELTVWYLEEREKNRKWNINHQEINYKYVCLPGLHTYIQSMDMGVHLNPGLFMKLIKFKPDVIITSGYDALGYWSALLYSKLLRKKFMVWWGSTLESSRVKNKLVNQIRRVFFSSSNSFITYGTSSTQCLLHYGVNRDKIITGYNTVDVKYFHKKYKEKIQNSLLSTHQEIQLLYVGQLISRKGLTEVIDALQKVSSKNWRLKIVGSGPEEDTYRNQVKNHGLENKISFEGYKQKEQLISYLIEADCLVFPSLIEVWGLVVNEALATRTFVIASKYAGATKDIIVDKVNGIVVDPLDEGNLIQSISWVCDNQDYLKSNWKLNFGIWRKIHPNSYARSVSLAIKKAMM